MHIINVFYACSLCCYQNDCSVHMRGFILYSHVVLHVQRVSLKLNVSIKVYSVVNYCVIFLTSSGCTKSIALFTTQLELTVFLL